jgi:hypothetical protein
MKPYNVTASILINAPAALVYSIIADYRNGHPRILPKPYFVSMEVLGGGEGAGTVIQVQMRVLGTTKIFRATISEPEPGRALVETNDSGEVTTFTVKPVADGKQACVTFTTELPSRGLLAPLERILSRLMLRKIYARELALLAILSEERARAEVT